MWKEMVRVSLAASLWVSALALMFAASFDGQQLYLAGWSVLSAMAGTTLLCWHLFAVERVRVETIADLTREIQPEGLRRL